jgi:hypothetical protein
MGPYVVAVEHAVLLRVSAVAAARQVVQGRLRLGLRDTERRGEGVTFFSTRMRS